MGRWIDFTYIAGEDEAMNRFFKQYVKRIPKVRVLDVVGSVMAAADALPDPWDMSEDEREAFVEKARNKFNMAFFVCGSDIEDDISDEFADILRREFERRMLDGCDENGLRHITPSASDFNAALDKALDLYSEDVLVHFREVELPEATEAHMERFEEEYDEDVDMLCSSNDTHEEDKQEAMNDERERFQSDALSYFNDYRLPTLLKEFEADFRKQWEESR